MSDVKISLIVATLDRPKELLRLLGSLDEQTYKSFEVIVVDQSDCVNFNINRRACAAYQDQFRLTHLRDHGRGLSRARNIGLQVARGHIIGFPDDDCWYGSGLLDKVVQIFTMEKTPSFVAGIYSLPGVRNERFSPKTRRIGPIKGDTRGVCSVGLFFQRDVLHGVVFDESLGAGTPRLIGEETDFVLQVLKKGCAGLYDPSLVVYHEIDRTSWGARRILTVDQTRAYVAGKNWKVPTPFIVTACSIVLCIGRAALLNRHQLSRASAKARGLLQGLRDSMRNRRLDAPVARR